MAVAFEHGRRQRLRLFGEGDVAKVREDVEPAVFNFAHGGVEPLRAQRRQHHFRSGLGQPLGGFLAQPAWRPVTMATRPTSENSSSTFFIPPKCILTLLFLNRTILSFTAASIVHCNQ